VARAETDHARLSLQDRGSITLPIRGIGAQFE